MMNIRENLSKREIYARDHADSSSLYQHKYKSRDEASLISQVAVLMKKAAPRYSAPYISHYLELESQGV